ncbi:MAG: hypothetical protein J7502_06175 [Flavisolibacter sp.]|nr:hypothetical protein [Flavisolibacter sp.]
MGFGNGEISFGIPKPSYYGDEFVGFDTILKQASFKIDDKKDIDSINLFITKFEKRADTQMSNQPLDAYRFELFINDHKKIDVFGRHMEVVSPLLKLLSKHLPFEIDYACF